MAFGMSPVPLQFGSRGGGGDPAVSPETWPAIVANLGLTQSRTGGRDGTNLGTYYAADANVLAMHWSPELAAHGPLIRLFSVNKVTAAKHNPAGTTNTTTGGDAGGALSATSTVPVGLGAFAKYGPAVYKIDNSAGEAAFYVRFGGTTGGTGVHSISAVVLGAGSILLYDGTTETGATPFDEDGYWQRVKSEGLTPANSSQEMAVKVAAGDTAWLVVPQMEARAYADPAPIPGSTGTALVNTEKLSGTIAVMPDVLTVEIVAPHRAGISDQFLFYAWDGTVSNIISLSLGPADVRPRLSVANSTVWGPNATTGFNSGSINKIRMSIASGDISLHINDESASTSASAFTMPALTSFAIGSTPVPGLHVYNPIYAFRSNLLAGRGYWGSSFFDLDQLVDATADAGWLLSSSVNVTADGGYSHV